MERLDEVDEILQFFSGARCNANNVINVPTIEIRNCAGVLSKDPFVNVTHEDTNQAGTKFGTHDYARFLEVLFAIKLGS